MMAIMVVTTQVPGRRVVGVCGYNDQDGAYEIGIRVTIPSHLRHSSALASAD